MKIERRIPKEQYGYYNIIFDSKEEFEKEFKNIKIIIDEVELSAVEKELDDEFVRKGSFIS